MKQRLLALVLALAILTCTGCSDWEDTGGMLNDLAEFYQEENQEPEAEPLTSFTLPYIAGESLDPLTVTDQVQQAVGALLYEGLFALDADYTLTAVLAESWQYDETALTWTITLKSGVAFSDGTALTAQDVAASLERARSSQRYGARLREVTSVTARGSDVVLTLSEPLSTLLWRLDIPIVKAGTESNTVPTGTGPYVFCQDSGGAYLTANRHWHQNTPLPLERIELQHCKDRDSALYAFSSREVQLLVLDLTDGDGSGVSVLGDYTEAPTAVMQFIGINTGHAALQDASLRQALSAGIDRASLVSSCLLGHGTAAQLPASPAYSGYDTSLETPYTAGTYLRLLTEALGTAEEDEAPITLTLLVNEESSFKVSAAQEIALSLTCERLQITVESVPWETFLSRLESGSFDLYYGEVRLTADWDVQSLTGTSGSLNYGGYSSEKTDTLLAACRTAVEQHRAEALNALWQQLLEEAPLLPLCFKTTTVLTTEGVVEGLTPTETDPFSHLSGLTIHLNA